MINREQLYQEKREEAKRGKWSFVCPWCHGDFMAGTRYVPHADDCTNPRWLEKKERQRQDREAAALRRLQAPLKEDPGHPWDHDCPECEDARRRALNRAGLTDIPGLRPKDQDSRFD